MSQPFGQATKRFSQCSASCCARRSAGPITSPQPHLHWPVSRANYRSATIHNVTRTAKDVSYRLDTFIVFMSLTVRSEQFQSTAEATFYGSQHTFLVQMRSQILRSKRLPAFTQDLAQHTLSLLMIVPANASELRLSLRGDSVRYCEILTQHTDQYTGSIRRIQACTSHGDASIRAACGAPTVQLLILCHSHQSGKSPSGVGIRCSRVFGEHAHPLASHTRRKSRACKNRQQA